MTVFLASAALLSLGVLLWWWRIRLKPAQLETVVNNNNAKNVFVLVHGTFASAAKWTTKDSNLVKAISAPNADTAVYSFVWWGRNSVRQRLYYAKELAKQLSGIRTQHPDAGVTIIAHSHGGAVSLKALEFCDSAHCDIRLICLSTPFLHVRERAPGLLKGASVFVRGTFLVAGVVACAPLATIADQYHWSIYIFRLAPTVNFITNVESGPLSPASRSDIPGDHRARTHANEELKEALGGLAIPFDLAVVQWRVTEWSDDGKRGLMLPYADPRAYSDRLNDLFTPAGWSRKYTVQASAPVQRTKRGPAAKILVTCEVTIASIGTNSGTGEEWSDKENGLTGAEAQAFKRALSLFGLGRYLYDIDGEWVELNEHGLPIKIPRLPRWATPNGWLAGLRPKPRRNRHALVRANGHTGNGQPPNQQTNGHRQQLLVAIEGMEHKIGKHFYRGLLKRLARAWSPQQIQEVAVLEKALACISSGDSGSGGLAD